MYLLLPLPFNLKQTVTIRVNELTVGKCTHWVSGEKENGGGAEGRSLGMAAFFRGLSDKRLKS